MQVPSIDVADELIQRIFFCIIHYSGQEITNTIIRGSRGIAGLGNLGKTIACGDGNRPGIGHRTQVSRPTGRVCAGHFDFHVLWKGFDETPGSAIAVQRVPAARCHRQETADFRVIREKEIADINQAGSAGFALDRKGRNHRIRKPLCNRGGDWARLLRNMPNVFVDQKHLLIGHFPV